MEEKKKRLLKLAVSNEESDETKRGPLAEHVEDFHKQYESLFSQYDNVTGKLKDKINKPQQKKEKLCSSSK